ncbi:HalOD1 output domain-containing protein [Halegenticoccus soli]|uniref:HalOD1 output domain-containing protein n=1 Tax=Halegenticoccus soli TaxID=1985678 RepID=UPI000C6D1F40|nr:HalOD1 output domain-containing protein [Halegenticoccus soli]
MTSPTRDRSGGGRYSSTYLASFDPSKEYEPSLAVLRAIADLTGTSIEELPCIDDAVDSDALNALFSASGTEDFTGSLTFRCCGFDVTATSDGDLTLSSRDRDSSRERRRGD